PSTTMGAAAVVGSGGAELPDTIADKVNNSNAAKLKELARDHGPNVEWAEELDADWEPDFRLVGLLNDDSNPVGSVHLGVVFTVEAAGRPVRVRETDKLTGRMPATEDLAAAWDRLETWSQLVAAHLLGLDPPS
ncbi:MAG TPA: hypothetical protein VHK28_10205, partial [Candidatus Limnocylindria bacterium]|nr:hypothetical protein [Candidatus Limnocylindria bacterium]